MFTTLIVFQVLVAIGLIAIVLVQRGPGATMGAAFGSGASGTVFGSRGAGNFLTRTTSWLAVAFFGISLSLAILATGISGGAGADPDSALSGSVMEQEQEQQGAGDDAEAQLDTALDSALEQLDEQQLDEPPAEELPPGSEDGPSAAGADEEPVGASGDDPGDSGAEPPAGT